jgi:hypothetical protein
MMVHFIVTKHLHAIFFNKFQNMQKHVNYFYLFFDFILFYLFLSFILFYLIAIIRTRKPELLNECDIVVDVGAEYDPSRFVCLLLICIFVVVFYSFLKIKQTDIDTIITKIHSLELLTNNVE